MKTDLPHLGSKPPSKNINVDSKKPVKFIANRNVILSRPEHILTEHHTSMSTPSKFLKTAKGQR